MNFLLNFVPRLRLIHQKWAYIALGITALACGMIGFSIGLWVYPALFLADALWMGFLVRQNRQVAESALLVELAVDATRMAWQSALIILIFQSLIIWIF